MTGGLSLLKFFAERGGPGTVHRDTLHWPGTADGFPFRGPAVPQLHDDEYANIPLALDYHSKRFFLWEEADKLEFDVVMDHIANGLYLKYHRESHWDAEHQAPVVWLEWLQVYGETPPGKQPHLPAAQPLQMWPNDARPASTGS